MNLLLSAAGLLLAFLAGILFTLKSFDTAIRTQKPNWLMSLFVDDDPRSLLDHPTDRV